MPSIRRVYRTRTPAAEDGRRRAKEGEKRRGKAHARRQPVSTCTFFARDPSSTSSPGHRRIIGAASGHLDTLHRLRVRKIALADTATPGASGGSPPTLGTQNRSSVANATLAVPLIDFFTFYSKKLPPIPFFTFHTTISSLPPVTKLG